MKLQQDDHLETSSIVANCNMNRERNLRGSNGYDVELRFDPMDFLRERVDRFGHANWLDLCCGTATALAEASANIDESELPISIVGVDLVGMFKPSTSSSLTLIEASLRDWNPKRSFDLITCVHGLHYIGDKLDLIRRATSWLTDSGRFVASLDPMNLQVTGMAQNAALESLRRSGLAFDPRHMLLSCDEPLELQIPLEYLGADTEAGPNYTGQPAVTSHYRLLTSTTAPDHERKNRHT